MKLKTFQALIILIIFLPINVVNSQTDTVLDSNLFNNTEIEKAREFMLEMYSSKIQDHVLFLAAVVGAWYTVLTNLNKGILKNRLVFSLIFACLVWLLLYSFGRLVFWSQYNSILLIIKPLNRTDLIVNKYSKPMPEGYLENIKWNLHDAIIRRIRGEYPYESYPRSINKKIAYSMAWSWLFNFKIHVIALISFYVSFYREEIQDKTKPHSDFIMKWVSRLPFLLFLALILLWFLYERV